MPNSKLAPAKSTGCRPPTAGNCRRSIWLSREEPDGTCIGLTYHSAGVVIAGENFGRLGWMIDRRMCVFLQEHDPQRHRPPAPGAPVIRRMEFFYPPQIAPTDPARKPTSAGLSGTA